MKLNEEQMKKFQELYKKYGDGAAAFFDVGYMIHLEVISALFADQKFIQGKGKDKEKDKYTPGGGINP